jgi:hypothetical protein
LLKGKISAESFEQEATRTIERSFGPLYRAGYIKWVGLSLARLLEPDKAFHVASPVWDDAVDGEPNYYETRAAPPEESRHLRFGFGQKGIPRFVVPDFIVHSAKIDSYVAVGSALGRAYWGAANASKKREWYPLKAVKKEIYGPAGLKPDLLIYIDDRPQDVALIADADKICRPDLTIECREQKDWYEKQGLDEIKLHYDSLKPKLGTYVVSRELVSEQAYKELMPEEVSKGSASEQEQKPTQEQEPEKQGAKIYILTVGFDQSKLAPIVDAFIS